MTAAIPFARPEIVPEAREAAVRAMESGWITTGPEVGEFERELAARVGAAHAVAVASCTAAIQLGLRALDLPPSSPVLTSTLTFCGVVQAILHAGLRPVLVDVREDTLAPDAATTAAAVRRCGQPAAMVALHFAGDPAPVEELADAAGLPLTRVVEDAAHALATRVGVREVGAISAATCFSFYATKNLPIGEGGMLTTDNPAIADFARRAALHGMSRDAWKRYQPGSQWRYSVDVEGLKANMTDVQAAIGRAQLRHLDRWQRRREELAAQYDRRLGAVPGLRLPSRPGPAGGAHAWHLYVVQVEPELGIGRDALFAALAERGIGCSVHFIPVHHQPYFRRVLGAVATCGLPGADAAFERIISLPIYPAMDDGDVAAVCDAIAGAAAR